jgi:DNA-binding IclR family transcriptional regulator
MPSQTATNSLERALVLLQIVARKPGGLSHAEIRRQLSIPKSSCTYILSRLEREAYLTRDPNTGRYKLGLNTLSLAHDALYSVRFRAVTEPVLYKLATETGLAASSGVWNKGRVLLVDRVESPQFTRRAAVLSAEASAESNPGTTTRTEMPNREERDIGRELPAHATALGRVLLAYQPRKEMLGFLQDLNLVKYTRRTVATKSELLEELETVRRKGYAIVDDEYYSGICALSAPVFDHIGQVQAAISVSGGRNLSGWADPQDWIELVRTSARYISKALS